MAKSKEMPTQERLKELLTYEPETGKLFWKRRPITEFSAGKHPALHNCAKWNAKFAGKEAFTATKGDGYKHTNLGGHWLTAHRVIWKMETGKDPDQIDHIDGNRANNIWGNLRDVDCGLNLKNMKKSKRNSSGAVGVRLNKKYGYWQAFITVDYQFISLGVYKDINEAIAARKAAELEFGFHANHGR